MSTFSWRVLRLPLLITLLWGLLLFTLFRWTAQREDEYTTGLARIQTAASGSASTPAAPPTRGCRRRNAPSAPRAARPS